LVRSGLRTIASNDYQATNLASLKMLQGLAAARVGFEFLAARAAKHRTASLNDASDISGRHLNKVTRNQTGVSVTCAEDFPASVQPGSHDGTHGAVHSRRISAARQDRNAFHFSSAQDAAANRIDRATPVPFGSSSLMRLSG